MITLDSFSSLGEAPRALVQDVLGGRAPHAALITGIAGAGKRTLARLLACALLCVGEGQRPCMQCKGCRRVLAGTHPDLLTPSCTDKDRTIKVDHLREVLRALSFHALEGRRVILLENAQRMTVQAQNALLKSLEEPDGETHFILTASGETGILPTVRSRCVLLRINEDAQDDEQAVRDAEELLEAAASGSRVELLRWSAAAEGMDTRRAAAMVNAARARLADILRGEAGPGLDAAACVQLDALFQRCSAMLKLNTGVRHVLGLIAVSAEMRKSN